MPKKPHAIKTHTLESLHARCVEEGDCLLWQGGCDGHGRPQCRHGGKTCYVRRVMRELVDGKPVPTGRVVPASCGNRLCVSPKCSEVGTDKRRAQLAAQRGAFSSAAKTARMVATKARRSDYPDALVDQVRRHPGPASAAAALVGMSLSHAKAIRRGASRIGTARNPFAGLMT